MRFTRQSSSLRSWAVIGAAALGTMALVGPVNASTSPPSTEVTSTTTAVATTDTSTTITPTETTSTTVGPASTLPTIYFPDPFAEVRLGCGSTETTRTILSFVNNAPADRQTTLSSATGGPESGYLTVASSLVVGDETSTELLLFWFMPGLYQGPWQVDSVIDTCSTTGALPGPTPGTALAQTGTDHVAPAAILAAVVFVAGGLLLRIATKRHPPA